MLFLKSKCSLSGSSQTSLSLGSCSGLRICVIVTICVASSFCLAFDLRFLMCKPRRMQDIRLSRPDRGPGCLRLELDVLLFGGVDNLQRYRHHRFKIRSLFAGLNQHRTFDTAAVSSRHLPLHVQSVRVAGLNVGKPTQTRPRPQTCFEVPQAVLVHGPANCAVAATAKVKRVAMIEVCILEAFELLRLR